MDVIGGEFAIDPTDLTDGKVAVESEATEHKNSRLFSCGRAALYYILHDLEQEQQRYIALPDYLCSSITGTVMDANWNYQFYRIREDFYPDIQNLKERLGRCKTVLLINYFGLLDLDPVIRQIRMMDDEVSIIVDDVQNYYGIGEENSYDYIFSSYRKWFAVPDGAEAIKRDRWNDIKLSYEENKFAGFKLAGNLLKSFAPFAEEEVYLELLKRGENILEHSYFGKMSEGGKWLFQRLKLEEIKQKRMRNACILHCGLEQIGIRHLYQERKVPLFIPIVLDEGDRDRIRSAFFDKKIFCPIHWPQESIRINGKNDLYQRELSLICDQRYTERDMECILNVLRENWNGYKDC